MSIQFNVPRETMAHFADDVKPEASLSYSVTSITKLCIRALVVRMTTGLMWL